MTSLSTFRAAVRADDHVLLAQGVRDYRRAGFTDREIYRIALSADPGLDLDTWNDKVKAMTERQAT